MRSTGKNLHFTWLPVSTRLAAALSCLLLLVPGTSLRAAMPLAIGVPENESRQPLEEEREAEQEGLRPSHRRELEHSNSASASLHKTAARAPTRPAVGHQSFTAAISSEHDLRNGIGTALRL